MRTNYKTKYDRSRMQELSEAAVAVADADRERVRIREEAAMLAGATFSSLVGGFTLNGLEEPTDDEIVTKLKVLGTADAWSILREWELAAKGVIKADKALKEVISGLTHLTPVVGHEPTRNMGVSQTAKSNAMYAVQRASRGVHDPRAEKFIDAVIHAYATFHGLTLRESELEILQGD